MVPLIIIVSILSAQVSSAKLIKYRDESGNLFVVDSEDMIPEKYRQKSKKVDRGVTEVKTPCDGKEMCAVAYFITNMLVDNPSDLVLNMSKEFLKLQPKNSEHGIMVMVGQGTVVENEKAAQLVGPKAVVDHQNRIATEFKSITTPFYFVQNKNKEVIFEGPKAKEWVDLNYALPEVKQ